MAARQRLARAYVVALLVSVAVHVGLLLLVKLVWYRPDGPATSRPPPPSEWMIVDVVPVPPPLPEPEPLSPPQSPARNSGPKKRVKSSPPLAEEPLKADAPRATDAEPSAPVSLFPTPDLSPHGELPVAPGHTLFPDDLSLRPEALRHEEENRVRRRVQGMAEEDLAERRAQSGLPHPYFAGVRDNARAGLDKRAKEQGVKATLGQLLGSEGHRYVESLHSYGKNGDPNVSATGSPARAPEPVGNHGNEVAEALNNGAEAQASLATHKPLVTLKLELRQFRDGRPLTAVLIQRSGSPKFDALVLDSWPRAVEENGPPPDDAFHGPVLRSIWEVEGWLGLPKNLEKVVTYLPMPMGTDKLLGSLTKEGYHYEFRTRLVRVY